MAEFLFKEETFKILGCCMNVQSSLGFGFSEVVYKDAMEIEFEEDPIPFLREPLIRIPYKGKILKRAFRPDFTCFQKVIVEAKSSDKGISEGHIFQTLNYLKASGLKVALIVNFGKKRLEYKRLACSLF
jgi:GxxExxY protein